jgi:hypothetical protein
MAHIVDTAKSGRARCRTCGEGILKGDLRFGEEVPNAFSDTGGTAFQWHHLPCAAKKKPSQLRQALETFAGTVPNRQLIDHLIAENEPKQKPTSFPYAERAASARSHCGECHTLIAKGALRVALQRENEGPSMMMPPTPRYYHAACLRGVLSGDAAAMLTQIRTNSRGLTQDDLDELGRALGPRAPGPLPPPADREDDPAPFDF